VALSPAELDAYCARIGYGGRREPSLAALRGIVAGHATAIPFENVDVLLGRRISLAPAALLDKLVRRRRGGYCFEHNTLLLQVLLTLGFAVEGLAGRVVWGRPDDSPGPRTHMLLRVVLPEGPYLADVGFGGLTLTAPLALALDAVQTTPHEPHRLTAQDEEIELQARLGSEWTRLYHFAPQRQFAIDYEVANWFTATYPEGLFTNNLLCARPDPDRRYALFNRDFTIHPLGRASEKRTLGSAGELGEVLARHFHLELPISELAEIDAVLDRSAHKGASAIG